MFGRRVVGDGRVHCLPGVDFIRLRVVDMSRIGRGKDWDGLGLSMR